MHSLVVQAQNYDDDDAEDDKMGLPLNW